MPALFHYTARGTDGSALRGTLQAADAAAAAARLRARALFITSLEPAQSVRGAVAGVLAGRVHGAALSSFFRSFAVLVHAGVPVRRALEVTREESTDRRLREALASIGEDIESGLPLSEAMGRRPCEFKRLHVALVAAGEAGGVLDEVLDRLASLLERDRAARKRLGAALVYPAAVTCAAFGLVAFLLTSVVPMFQGMYAQMRVPLPAITRLLIEVSGGLRRPWLWPIVILAAAAAAIALRGMRERIALRIPAIGPVIRKTAVATFSRTLGTLLRSGVGVVASLDAVAGAVPRGPYADSLRDLREGLANGSGFSESLAGSGLYDPLFLQMLRVGEETGALDAMLLRVAEYYDLDVETALSALGALIEPLMIVLLGGAVAFITAAIFVPLYSLIGSMR